MKATLAHFPDIHIRGYIDDNYIVCRRDQINDVLARYSLELAKLNLELQPSKCSFYDPHRDRSPAAPPLPDPATPYTCQEADGFTVTGVPIGTETSRRRALQATFDTLIAHVHKVSRLITVSNVLKPRKKEIYRLLRLCICPSMAVFHLRNSDPSLTRALASEYDDVAWQCILGLLDSSDDPALGITTLPPWLASIVSLRSSDGGLGLSTASSQLLPQHLGQLLLTSATVVKHLPLHLVESTAVRDRIAEKITNTRALLLEDVASHYTDISNLAGSPPMSDDAHLALENATPRVGSVVNSFLASYQRERLLSQYARVNPDFIALVRSGSKDGAAWLMAPASYRDGLSSDEFHRLLLWRIGVPPPSFLLPDHSPRSSCSLCGASPLCHSHGLHCHVAGRRSFPQALHSDVHYAIRGAITDLGKSTGAKSLCTTPTEPLASPRFPLRPDVAANPQRREVAEGTRADIALNLGHERVVLVDLTLTQVNFHCSSHGLAMLIVGVDGAAAEAAFLAKRKHYTDLFDIPSTEPFKHLVPLVFEHGGRIHPTSRAFIQDIVTYAVDNSRNVADWTMAQKVLYARCFRRFIDTLEVALAKSISRQLGTYDRLVLAQTASPPPVPSPTSPAHAQPEGLPPAKRTRATAPPVAPCADEASAVNAAPATGCENGHMAGANDAPAPDSGDTSAAVSGSAAGASSVGAADSCVAAVDMTPADARAMQDESGHPAAPPHAHAILTHAMDTPTVRDTNGASLPAATPAPPTMVSGIHPVAVAAAVHTTGHSTPSDAYPTNVEDTVFNSHEAGVSRPGVTRRVDHDSYVDGVDATDPGRWSQAGHRQGSITSPPADPLAFSELYPVMENADTSQSIPATAPTPTTTTTTPSASAPSTPAVKSASPANDARAPSAKRIPVKKDAARKVRANRPRDSSTPTPPTPTASSSSSGTDTAARASNRVPSTLSRHTPSSPAPPPPRTRFDPNTSPRSSRSRGGGVPSSSLLHSQARPPPSTSTSPPSASQGHPGYPFNPPTAPLGERGGPGGGVTATNNDAARVAPVADTSSSSRKRPRALPPPAPPPTSPPQVTAAAGSVLDRDSGTTPESQPPTPQRRRTSPRLAANTTSHTADNAATTDTPVSSRGTQ